MSDYPNERRKGQRFETDVRVYFYFTYDLNTKVEYRRVENPKHNILSEKHLATSKNVSVEGLCFVSSEQLKKGDELFLDVYLPGVNEPIQMDGMVRWSKNIPANQTKYYDTGVLIRTVNGEDVKNSIHHDKEYDVEWSDLLEMVLGNYSIVSKKRHQK